MTLMNNCLNGGDVLCILMFSEIIIIQAMNGFVTEQSFKFYDRWKHISHISI